jgi:uncharacterized protein (TIGR02300 family)
VTKPELGTKRRCSSCETKFFDLNKDPIICPKCSAVFEPPQPDPVLSRRAPGRQAWPAKKPTVPDVPNEFVSLGGTDPDEKAMSPAADGTEEDEDVVLLDDQDGQVDAREIIGGDIGKDEA